MTTKTPTPLDPNVELDQARADHEALVARIDSGENVSTDELVDAEARVRLAEHRLALLNRRARDSAESKRLAEIEQIYATLTTGRIPELAQTVLDSFTAAETALAQLHAAAETYNAEIVRQWRRLRQLRPVPDHLPLEVHSAPGHLEVAGTPLVAARQLPGHLVGQVVHTVKTLNDGDFRHGMRGNPDQRKHYRRALDLSATLVDSDDPVNSTG